MDLPRDNLVRALFPADLGLREASGDAGPTLTGHFAIFDEWTEINSAFEGQFMERIAPGAFRKTLQENTPKILFQHGRDPQIGDKPLGVATVVKEDERGGYYEAPLFDTGYNADLIPGLRAGAYGASFRFGVVKDEFVRDANKSEYNPKGLPERTITEARVMECGPVTFPAYAGATAGIRSLTDDFMFGRYALGNEPRPAEPELPSEEGENTTTTAEAEPPHSEEPSRDTPTDDDHRTAETTDTEETMGIIEEMRARQAEIRSDLEELSREHKGEVLVGDPKARSENLWNEWQDLKARIEAEEQRQEMLREMADDPARYEDGSTGGHTPSSRFSRAGEGTGSYVTKRDGSVKTPEDPFEVSGYHQRANSQEHLYRLYGEGARRAVESFSYPHPDAKRETVNEHIYSLLAQDSPDKEIAQRMIHCGSPAYRRAFWKQLGNEPLSSEERAALAVGSSTTGGAAVPVQIDPTVIPTSNGAINPFRQISRVFTTTSYQWQGVTSAGITASYQAEGAGMTDAAPTLAAPSITPERCAAFVPFSWELGQDWGSLEASLASAFQDSKDTAEALKFSVGAGHTSNEPQGILVGAGTQVKTALGTSFSVNDLYRIEVQLPARYIGQASWVAHPGMFQLVRQLDTYGGANLWTQLAAPNPPTLIGYPAYKASYVGTAGYALTATALWGVFGDFSRYAIVDRIGLNVRLIDSLFAGTAAAHYPTGQSGLVAWWRNSAGVLDSNAFRVGTIATGG